MTCIVGVIADDGVYMGGDSLASEPTSMDKYPLKGMSKVFHNGPLLIGVCGSLRMAQLLRYSLKIPQRSKVMSDHEFMATKFIHAVRRCFKDGGFGKMPEGEDNEGGNFIVGYRGGLYTIYVDFQVNEWAWNYAAIGSGGNYALGSLFMTEGVKPEQRIISALEAATHFNAGVSPPFEILHQSIK